jgi:(R,R)-butanediol dehydrogenase / meso-butanediol dehydrogenase / diacetyl reductase
MRAAYYEGNETFRVGPCLPVDPAPGHVQIRVSHCGICRLDLHIFHGHMDHLVRLPHVIGHEMSGSIVALGGGVAGFATGDRVTMRPLAPCGACPACHAGHGHICHNLRFIGIDSPGALQGVCTVPAHTLHRLPPTLPLELGALAEPLAVACHDVRLGEVRPGDYAVVLGGGPIGVLIALVARAAGARVVLSEINAFRLALAGELGLEAVDPRQTDLVELVNDRTNGAGADVVFEVSGSAAAAELMTKLPRTQGRIVVVGVFAEAPKIDLFRVFERELRLCGARCYESQDFEQAIQLASSGALPLNRLISKTISLDDLPAGIHQLERGEVMKILVRCAG